MVIATEIILLILCTMFFLSALGTDRCDLCESRIVGGVLIVVALLFMLIFT